jgi:glucokinase
MSMASYIVGIDIGGTNTNIGVVRPDGTVAAFASMATEKDSGPAVCVSRMLKETNALLGQSEFRKGQVLGVGMGMPGCIDIANGTVISSPNFPSSWFDFPLRDSIAKALRVPAVIDNDARAAMVGEGWCGVAKGVQNYVVLTLGTGIGGGAMLGGRILRGANGYAGEFGHICVRPGGRTCGCTRQGCVEAYASGTGVLGNFRELSAAAGVPAP